MHTAPGCHKNAHNHYDQLESSGLPKRVLGQTISFGRKNFNNSSIIAQGALDFIWCAFLRTSYLY